MYILIKEANILKFFLLIALYTEHNVRFKTVCWSLEPTECCVYLGDEIGNVLTLDTRKPQEILSQHTYFDRPLRKISPNG